MSGLSRVKALVAIFAMTSVAVRADEAVYTDNALASGWQDWSWGSTIVYTATDMKEGISSISVNSTAYSALSLYDPTPFLTYAGLAFDISVGTISVVQIYCT